MIKKLTYVDRFWGRIEEKDIVGDMSFTFNDSADLRTENTEEAIENCKEWCLGDEVIDACEVYDPEEGSFAIYEVLRADFEFEEEDDPLWYVKQAGEDEILLVCVCATEEQAGWVKDRPEYKGVTIIFREED